MAAIVVTLLLIVGAFLGPYIVGDPLAVHLSQSRLPFIGISGWKLPYVLGTDQLGRDEFSRVIYGLRTSLIVSAASLVIAVAFGVSVGLVVGYIGGLVDDLIMRIVDIQLTVPPLLLALVVVLVLGPSAGSVIFVLVLGEWVVFARLARGQVLAMRELDLVVAVRALGASSTRVLLRHILPNMLTPILITSTVEFGFLIIVSAALSYLGLGVPPPAPTLGGMISESQLYFLTGASWLTILPAVVISLLIASTFVIGDWLRSELDPLSRTTG